MMNKMLVAIGAVVVLIILFVFVAIGTINKEVTLRTGFEATEKNVAISFDKMWKTLANQAEINEKYKDDFKDVAPELVEARYKGGTGKLMAWIQEHNPEFTPDMYTKLMDSVAQERTVFNREQQKMIDYHREHTTYVRKPVSKTILNMFGDPSELEITLVTSSRTETVTATGKDDDVNLFDKKAEKD